MLAPWGEEAVSAVPAQIARETEKIEERLAVQPATVTMEASPPLAENAVQRSSTSLGTNGGRNLSALASVASISPPSLIAAVPTESFLAPKSAEPSAANPAGIQVSVQPPLQPPPSRTGRWSVSAWLFAREGSGRSLAAGGTLGGSQAGARLLYRLNEDARRPLSASLRAYSPLARPSEAEIAAGIEWQPIAALPVRLLAERREAVDDGRSAFALVAHGGVGDRRLAGPLMLDAYGQAGMVGTRSRDAFADGFALLSLAADRRGRFRIGAGLWGAAQLGVERLDAGPQAAILLPFEGGAFRLSADWRFRAAGDAEPGSGPTLTLSTSF